MNEEWMKNYQALSIEYVNKNYIVGEGEKCRFCGKDHSETTFSHLPHAVPEFLENKDLITKNECDICNAKFGVTIEDDFANYLDINRSLTRMEGKKGVPNKVFRNKKERLIFKKQKPMEVIAYEDSSNIVHDEANKSVIFYSIKEPYHPFGVFKCLTKIALSLMPEKYLIEFKALISWVESAHDDPIFLGPQVMQAIETFIPGPCPFPETSVLLLRRVDGVYGIPYMIFQITFKNFIYQIPLVRNRNDLPLAGEASLKFTMREVPTGFDFDEIKYPFGYPQKKMLNLAGIERVKNEKTQMSMSYSHMIPVPTDGMEINNKGMVDYDLNKIKDFIVKNK